jgi:AcrR family transcriptional regulator
MTDQATLERVLPATGEDESAKRRQIIDGARGVFLSRGFDAASMNDIARAAGVSKGTLYVYFADKSRLFEAMVEDEALAKAKLVYNLDPTRDVETTLREFGRAYVGGMCRPGGGSSIRTVMAIAERMPEVGRRFYENVLAKSINSLADYLQARVGPKDLSIDDCELAAAQFMQMCQATLFLPFVFQAEPAPSAERIARVVDSATRLFLQTYRTKPK